MGGITLPENHHLKGTVRAPKSVNRGVPGGRCPRPGHGGHGRAAPATHGASESENPEAWWPGWSQGTTQAQQLTGVEEDLRVREGSRPPGTRTRKETHAHRLHTGPSSVQNTEASESEAMSSPSPLLRVYPAGQVARSAVSHLRCTPLSSEF